MKVVFRCRIEKALLQKANGIAKQFGTSTSDLVRTFIAEMAQSGKARLRLEDTASNSWEQKAQMLESFYNKSKEW
jgi:antitoxin component of RelBE/YafQ-DinJ toxin-antitoxin module